MQMIIPSKGYYRQVRSSLRPLRQLPTSSSSCSPRKPSYHYRFLNPRAASEARVALPVAPPVNEISDGRNEPENGVDEHHPDGILHPLDVAVALGILVDVHLQTHGPSALCHSTPAVADVDSPFQKCQTGRSTG